MVTPVEHFANTMSMYRWKDRPDIVVMPWDMFYDFFANDYNTTEVLLMGALVMPNDRVTCMTFVWNTQLSCCDG